MLLAAGYRLWPTEILDDNEPDRGNEVHDDLIVLMGAYLGLGEAEWEQAAAG